MHMRKNFDNFANGLRNGKIINPNRIKTKPIIKITITQTKHNLNKSPLQVATTHK